jgi:DNA-binding NarL/FixJ family response regulator
MDRIIISAYNPLIIEGIKYIMKEKGLKFKIVGEATTIDHFLTLIEHKLLDYAIVDTALTWRSGVDFVEEVERRNKRVKIIPISVHPIDQHVLSGIKNRLQHQNILTGQLEDIMMFGT